MDLAKRDYERKAALLRQEYERQVDASKRACIAALRAVQVEETKRGRLEAAVALKKAVDEMAAGGAPWSDAAINDAISLLRARKDQPRPDSASAETGRVEQAIAALQEMSQTAAAAGPALPTAPDHGGAAPAADAGPRLTAAVLQRKFRGRVSFDAKANIVTLTYTFADARQLEDFEALNESKPRVGRGVIGLEPGESVRHVAAFKTLTANCVVTLGNTESDQTIIRTSNGVEVRVGRPNGTIPPPLMLWLNDKQEAQAKLRDPGPDTPVSLVVLPKRVGLKWGPDISLGKEGSFVTGRLEFLGGSGGMLLRGVTLTGELDDEWAREALAQ